MWNHRDTYLNPLKSIFCILGLAAIFALMMAGMVGALWAVTEVVRAIF